MESKDSDAASVGADTPNAEQEEEAALAAASRKPVVEVDYSHEGLGADEYKSTSWVRPEQKRAIKARRLAMYRRGNAPVCGTKLSSLSSLGPGTFLYFNLLRSLCAVFTVMLVFALPALLINTNGTSVSTEERDVLFTAYTTLANIAGVDNPRPDLPFLSFNLSAKESAYLVTACDVAYSLVFFIFISVFSRKAIRLAQLADEDNITPSDFAVFVTGLPKTTSKAEITKHFSELYQLERDDVIPTCFGCCRRVRKAPIIRKMAAALPSRQEATSDSGKRYTEDRWIAQVAVAHPLGGLIRKYVSSKRVGRRLRELRAEHKVARATKKGDEATLARIEQKIAAVEAKMEKQNARAEKKYAGKAEACVGAFVVFNHRQSLRRCLEDYSRSGTWRGKLTQPRRLRFRGRHVLEVVPAPEPSNILWENLETSVCSRRVRLAVTTVITLLLLSVSFAAVLVAQREKAKFAERSVSSTLCDEIPATFYGSYASAAAQPGAPVDIVRNRTRQESCPTGSIALEYPGTTALAPAAANLSAVCTDDCVPVAASSVKCQTLACLSPGEGKTCRSYFAGARLSCYCQSILIKRISEDGLIDGGQALLAEEKDSCETYAQEFLTAQGFSLTASFVIVFINISLRTILKSLAKFERHHSVTSQERAVSIKLLVASFLNTAIISLIVNGRLPNDVKAGVVSTLGIFDGSFDSFSKEWYTSVGVSIVLAVIVGAVLQHSYPLAYYFVIGPCRRRRARKRAITQQQLDEAYQGPSFTIGLRLAVQMNVLFVCLLYSSGMPLLLGVAAMSFILTYWLDKFFMLRVYRRPPLYDEEMMKLAMGLMPWALMLHLMFGIWMYSEPNLLASDSLSTASITSFDFTSSGKVTAPSWDRFGIVPRMFRVNTFPMVVLLAAVLASLILRATALKFVVAILVRTKRIFCFCCCCCCRRRAARIQPISKDEREERDMLMQESKGVKMTRAQRAELARWDTSLAYTDIFVQRTRRRTKVTKRERAEGWRAEELREGVQAGQKKQYIRYKVYVEGGTAGGVSFRAGQRKRVWEVIRDEVGAHSYSIHDNPAYVEALAGRFFGSDEQV